MDVRLHEDFLMFFGGAAGAVLKSMCSFFESELSPEKSPTDSKRSQKLRSCDPTSA